jgi:GTP-binding protein EngB required for normal cell division
VSLNGRKYKWHFLDYLKQKKEKMEVDDIMDEKVDLEEDERLQLIEDLEYKNSVIIQGLDKK